VRLHAIWEEHREAAIELGALQGSTTRV
jgi:hypothetical protein